MKKLILSLAVLFCSIAMIAQSTVTGKLVDASNDEALIGASIMVKGTSTGALTDIDGMFKIMNLEDGTYTLVMSYVGYNDMTSKVTVDGGNVDLGSVKMTAGGIGLESVVITGTMDIVRDRRTPVAVSTIGVREIQANAGNVEFPELMKNTPSIYVANQAGGYGDSEVFTRGFDQTNTAFLLNGQPINGMEDGRMYWSNWSGMTDVATAVQVQRGLGSSKLAISSVGGTTNIIMRAASQEQGGHVSYLRGNDNYNKATFMYNTGMSQKGFGMSVLLTHWQGDGWAEGTKGQGQNYFIAAGWKPNDKHELNFLITGAPQWHDQNFTKRISDHYGDFDGDGSEEFNIKYNGNWGYLDGEYFTERRNYYHKPVANLNWEFNINESSKLSTVLYASWGRGGGTGGLGNFGNRVRDEFGQIDFTQTVQNNITEEAAGGTPGRNVYVRRASVNNHQWFGAVANYEKTVSENVTFSLGADLRRYTGSHFRQVTDLLGASGYAQSGRTRFPDGYLVTNTFDPNPWKAVSNFASAAPAGERVAYNNDETITYSGVFGQLEYGTDKITAYVQGAVSNQGSVRFELFNETEANEESEKVNELGYNIKGGLSYLIDDNHSVFFNTGKYQRQPFFDNQFLNFSNTVNPVTAPEDIFGLELGYKYVGPSFLMNVNLYRTSWKGRVTTSTIDIGEVVDGFTFAEGGFINNAGLNQLHQGIEIDFKYRLNDDLSIKGYTSIGDWVYDGTVTRDLYEDNLDRTLVSSTADLDIDGIKVGGAAQTTFGLGADYQVVDNLRLDLDYNYYSKLYSNIGASTDELELPSFGLLDLGVSYNFDLANGQVLLLRANIY
ncbi:MAG: TonB-dependent receptor, partial [Saprospiraceae bacterium]|nr:TonB-dependent receptor [Saprospiraceae bacterium]